MEGSLTKEERMWAMACHLSALIGFVVPFGNIIAPLVIWLFKKEESAFINDQGKESLNFQITMTIYVIIGIILTFIVIGILVLLGLAIFTLVVIILASIKSSEGSYYRYPATIRFLR